MGAYFVVEQPPQYKVWRLQMRCPLVQFFVEEQIVPR